MSGARRCARRFECSNPGGSSGRSTGECASAASRSPTATPLAPATRCERTWLGSSWTSRREAGMAEVGYVGLGVMGSSIVRRLLADGHDVTVWNRTREKAEPLLAEGACWADSPREVAAVRELVFTMVTNTEAVRAVAEGEEGILAGLSPGAIYVDMSTASPANTRALAVRVTAVGAAMLDSPVSGTSVTVDQGKASLMLGGDTEVVER